MIIFQVYRKAEIDDYVVPGREKKKNLPKERKQAQKHVVVNGYDVENRGVSSEKNY